MSDETNTILEQLDHEERPLPANPLARAEALADLHFGIKTLRAEQRLALSHILRGDPQILATLPTGAGKTLLYALPALLFNGPVLVVSPLISLMRDQARRMNTANIPCCLFIAEQSEEERKHNYETLRSGQAKLIFVSPERLAMPSFLQRLAALRIPLAVIDEAHCVLSWGPWFRPEYAAIGTLLAAVKPAQIMALTATASRGGRAYIRDVVFNTERPVAEVVFPPLRKNIFLEARRVRSEDEKWEALVSFLREKQEGKSIVYFMLRKQCEEAVQRLRKSGIHAILYHAGMSAEARRQAESYVHATREKVVICATLAYGMGVDVAGVRSIAVYGFPSGIEEFFQMVGRAGRGGESAHAVLLWTGADPKKRMFQFEAAYPGPELLEAISAPLTYALRTQVWGKFLTHAEVTDALKLGEKTSERALTGILTALRVLGILQLPHPRTYYVELALSHNISIEDILLALPPGVTRRSKLLQAISRAAGEGFHQTRGATTLLPTHTLLDSARLTWEQCEEVLRHFAASEKVTWRLLSPEHLQEGVIIAGSMAQFRHGMQRYLKLRRCLSESLAELERLARSTGCRLASAHQFFAAHQKERLPRRCEQCDHCFGPSAP
jgi:ATP-dependent DNA helicase RecQ